MQQKTTTPEVARDLILSGKAPEGMVVSGTLKITDAHITYGLPKGLRILGGLNLCGSIIETLPGDLFVRYNIGLVDTDIKSIPNTMEVLGDIFIIRGTTTSLPDNFTVIEDLWLEETKIKTLPENLTVGEVLSITNSLIVSLPDSLSCNCVNVDENFFDRVPEEDLPLWIGINLYCFGGIDIDMGSKLEARLKTSQHCLRSEKLGR